MQSPALQCQYFLRGACLQKEVQNPGYDPALRCVRLTALADAWDDFLDRAEAFNLTEEEAARIWNGRRHSALSDRDLCSSPLSGGESVRADSALLDCRYLFNTACVLAMQKCAGRCEMYSERSRTVGIIK